MNINLTSELSILSALSSVNEFRYYGSEYVDKCFSPEDGMVALPISNPFTVETWDCDHAMSNDNGKWDYLSLRIEHRHYDNGEVEVFIQDREAMNEELYTGMKANFLIWGIRAAKFINVSFDM